MDITNITCVEDLRGREPSELQTIVAAIDAELVAIHEFPDGSLRRKSPRQEERFDELLVLRDAATERIAQHARAQDALERGRYEVAFDERRAGGTAWSARRDDPDAAPLLSP